MSQRQQRVKGVSGLNLSVTDIKTCPEIKKMINCSGFFGDIIAFLYYLDRKTAGSTSLGSTVLEKVKCETAKLISSEVSKYKNAPTKWSFKKVTNPSEAFKHFSIKFVTLKYPTGDTESHIVNSRKIFSHHMAELNVLLYDNSSQVQHI